ATSPRCSARADHTSTPSCRPSGSPTSSSSRSRRNSSAPAPRSSRAPSPRSPSWSSPGSCRRIPSSSPATGGDELNSPRPVIEQQGGTMDFEPTAEVAALRERILDFMDAKIYPAERELTEALDAEVGPGVPYPANLVAVREEARADGLWNLFMPDERFGPGLSNWEYGLLCEEMGRSPVAAAMAFNCAAPDTGNMEILAEHGTAEQQERWLEPLLEGRIRSCFSMTEPEVSGSDPTLLRGRAVLDGDEWVIDAHKWYTSGAVGADLAIAMVVTDPDAPTYARASMICVPTDTPGYELVRPIPVMGHDKGPGHCEIRYTECRVPKENLLGERGAGFAV